MKRTVLAVPALCALAFASTVHAQGIPQQLKALQARVASLEATVSALQANNALKLGPFVSVDSNTQKGVIGPNITFTGANIHIVSGLGATDDNGSRSGLGNLIIGYDELDPNTTPNRSGSHNLVIGRFNTFTSSAWGGLVAGEDNTIQSAGATVSGGLFNIASGELASVSGGVSNVASGAGASVSGGFSNFSSGNETSVSGGFSNTASGAQASVSGGFSNTASGVQASVIGGRLNNANTDYSIRPQPPFP
jgi:hypothetical protein